MRCTSFSFIDSGLICKYTCVHARNLLIKANSAEKRRCIHTHTHTQINTAVVRYKQCLIERKVGMWPFPEIFDILINDWIGLLGHNTRSLLPHMLYVSCGV